MRPLINDLARLQHQDAVGPADLAQAVGDEERGAPATDAVHGLLDQVFGGAVDGAGAVVEDEDARIGEKGASDGDTLALSARKHHPTLADFGVVALGETCDEIMRLPQYGQIDSLNAAVAGSIALYLARQARTS